MSNSVTLEIKAEAELIGNGTVAENNDKLDISDEIGEIVQNGFANLNSLKEFITGSPFSEADLLEDLDYIEIVEVDLFKLDIPIAPTGGLVGINVDVTAVLAVGAKVGI